jgi:hypothetical protein
MPEETRLPVEHFDDAAFLRDFQKKPLKVPPSIALSPEAPHVVVEFPDRLCRDEIAKLQLGLPGQPGQVGVRVNRIQRQKFGNEAIAHQVRDAVRGGRTHKSSVKSVTPPTVLVLVA